MEHISKAIQVVTENLQVEKVPGPTNSLTSYETRSKAQDPDKRMMELKYAAPLIADMTGREQSMWAKSLLLKIHVITGWVIPETELLNILVDQFGKKLIESYGNMNVEEIEYAFRKFGTTKPDWGKLMNLAMIDDILIPYMNQRYYLSAEEEKKKAEPPPQRIYTPEEIDNEYRAEVETFYQRCRKGIVPYAVPQYFEDILKKDGLLKGETVAEYLTRKLNSGAENIYVKTD